MNSVMLEQMKLLTSIVVSEKAPGGLKDMVTPILSKMFCIVQRGIEDYEEAEAEYKKELSLQKSGIIH